MIRVAINGFGRIGRMVFKAGYKDPDIDFVAFNDLTDTKTLAQLLKYDSVHGRFPGTVEAREGALVIDGKEIKVLSERDPAVLPWRELGIDIVIESTGFFLKRELAQKHVDAGAKKVLLTAPGKDADTPTVVKGCTSKEKCRADWVISNASCTTNSLAPVVQVLEKNFGIESGLMTTIHAYTGDQRLLDAPHNDLRRARAAALNIIPTSTGAAKAVGKVFPELNGKLDGLAVRVPVADGSLTDFTVLLKKEATAEEINAAVKKASETYLKGVLQYSEDPLVSTDIIGNPHSAIFDSAMTRSIGRLAKVFAWYDNEWGYSNRLVDIIKEMV
ncbi:MAG: type I glyceraldehyde-3-phosphate dehydrogenase [Candidatus Hydrothermarchaeales archaeon]